MSTYNTIAELLASIENLVPLRVNSKQDDGTDTITGVDWFVFNNRTAENLYLSGNGWLNFGDSNEGGLKVNRRDQAMWNSWREEGTIKTEFNKFLRVRWDGYSYHGTTAESAHLTFDVVMCDTGDIVLNIVTYPTSYTDGANVLESETPVSFSPSSDNKTFTFIHQNDTGTSFNLINGLEEVYENSYTVNFNGMGGYGTMTSQKMYSGWTVPLNPNQFSKGGCRFLGWDTDSAARTVVYTDEEQVTDIASPDTILVLYAVWQITWGWLVESANKFYTLTSGNLTEITGISALSADVFKEYGFQSNPPSASLKLLSSPSIYKWSENSLPTFSAKVSAVPVVPQLVVYQTVTLAYDIDAVTILDGGDTVLWNVSFDNGTTWKKYDGTDWVTVTIEGDGCTDGYIEMLTASDWAQYATQGDTLKFRAWISENGWIKEVRIDYVEE